MFLNVLVGRFPKYQKKKSIFIQNAGVKKLAILKLHNVFDLPVTLHSEILNYLKETYAESESYKK